MKFRDTQFVEAIELIQASGSKKSRKDKRRAARTTIRVPVSIKSDTDSKNKWTDANLRDISPRGAKLETAAAMEVGCSFLLRLPSKDGNESIEPHVCRVAHCISQKEFFLIGAEFTGRLTPGKSAGDNAADFNRIQRSILE